MSEYLLWLLSHGVTLCAHHSAASSHQFLSFHCPSLVTTQQIWYLERKKPKTTTQNTHTLLCLFLCLSARSVKLCCCVYNVTDISVTQNRFCRTLLLCLGLPCRRRQQHRLDEERRAGLVPPPKARPCVPATEWGGAGTGCSVTFSSPGWDEVQGSSSAHRGAWSSPISAGLWAGPHQLYKTLSIKLLGSVQNKSWAQRGSGDDHRSVCSSPTGEKRWSASFWSLSTLPKPLPE